MTLGQTRLAFLDVETTGFACEAGDAVCEIGILLCQGLRPLREFSSLINPQRPITWGASLVNGISDEMVNGAPLFEEIAGEVLGWIGSSVLVCHNASFDIPFLRQEFLRIGSHLPERPVLDTLWIARRRFHFPSNALPNLVVSLGVPVERLHRALDDARATHGVFCRMLERLGKSEASPLEEIFELQEPPGLLRWLRRKISGRPAVRV